MIKRTTSTEGLFYAASCSRPPLENRTNMTTSLLEAFVTPVLINASTRTELVSRVSPFYGFSRFSFKLGSLAHTTFALFSKSDSGKVDRYSISDQKGTYFSLICLYSLFEFWRLFLKLFLSFFFSSCFVFVFLFCF